jgi:arylsulfatase A-like enzyme
MIKKILFFSLLLNSVFSFNSVFGQQKPNVIFILADDLGYGDLSCYGQKTLKTPNIDALAKGGMKFTQHYAGSSVCAPSRCALMTGKHVGHTSVRGNQPKGQLIKPEETTLAEVFKNAGYKTALIGKWGMGNAPEPNDPLQNGFDYHYGYVNMWHAHNFYPEFLYRNAEKVSLNNKTGSIPKGNFPEGVGLASVRNQYAPDEFDRETLEFISKNQSNPFFIYYAINTPHGNTEYKENGNGMEVPDTKAFDDKNWNNAEKSFAEMIRKLDESVGKIQAKLKELGIDKNTMIVFASDNGPHNESGHDSKFFDSNGVFKGSKRDMYEGGIRVPFIVNYPAKIKAGQTSKQVFAFWDFLPTACELTNQPVPQSLDGISYLPTLFGKPQTQKHQYLYWEFYEEGGKQAVLWKNWKGIRLNTNDASKTRFELYNLNADIGETKDIAAQNLAIKEKIEAMMAEAHRPFELTSLFKNDPSAQRDVQKKE